MLYLIATTLNINKLLCNGDGIIIVVVLATTLNINKLLCNGDGVTIVVVLATCFLLQFCSHIIMTKKRSYNTSRPIPNIYNPYNS